MGNTVNLMNLKVDDPSFVDEDKFSISFNSISQLERRVEALKEFKKAEKVELQKICNDLQVPYSEVEEIIIIASEFLSDELKERIENMPKIDRNVYKAIGYKINGKTEEQAQ